MPGQHNPDVLASLHEAVRPLQLAPKDGNRSKGPYTTVLSLLMERAGPALYDDALGSAHAQATPTNRVGAHAAMEHGVRNFREAVNPEVLEDGTWVTDHRDYLHTIELPRLFTLLHRIVDADRTPLASPASLLSAYATEAILHAAMTYPKGPIQGRRYRYPFASFVSAQEVAPYFASYPTLGRKLVGQAIRDNRHHLEVVPEILQQKATAVRQRLSGPGIPFTSTTARSARQKQLADKTGF